MSKIKIICTSTGCIEYAPERYRNLGIDILRVHLTFEGKEYIEGPDIDPVEFYERMETIENPRNNLPKTSVPSRGEVNALFDKAIEEGYDEIIAITISSGLGGTYNQVAMAAKDYEDKIKVHVVDSRTTSFVEGLLAVRAQEMVNKGYDAERILKEIAWMKKRQRFLGIDGKLDYLIYNGRLKGAKAFMGQVLKICPLLHFNENGEAEAIESVRTQKKALLRAIEVIKETIGDRSPEDYILFHVYTGKSPVDILRELEEKEGFSTNHEEVIMSPVSGCHNGPWLAGYGLQFIRREDEPLDD
jgi:DegV family protein with EDD domain